MANNTAFIGYSNTFNVTASTTASTPVQIAPPAGVQGSTVSTYRVINSTSSVVFFVLTQAATLATVPAAGGNAPGYAIAPGVTEIFNGPGNAYFSCIAASGTGQVYVNGGEGL